MNNMSKSLMSIVLLSPKLDTKTVLSFCSRCMTVCCHLLSSSTKFYLPQWLLIRTLTFHKCKWRCCLNLSSLDYSWVYSDFFAGFLNYRNVFEKNVKHFPIFKFRYIKGYRIQLE